MEIRRLEVGPIGTNCYILRFEDKIAVIDPGDEASRIAEGLDRLDWILLTHAHWDHMLALGALASMFPEARLLVHSQALYSKESQLAMMDMMDPRLGRFYAARFENLPRPAAFLKDGDRIGPLEVVHTPGHSPGSVCFHSKADDIIFSGDTLFADGCGRTDLEGGSDVLLYQSLVKISKLATRKTVIHPGHGESSAAGRALALVLGA